jgi:hypothetical protein
MTPAIWATGQPHAALVTPLVGKAKISVHKDAGWTAVGPNFMEEQIKLTIIGF